MTGGAHHHPTIPVKRFRGDAVTEELVAVTQEYPLTVFYNGLEVITLLATPEHLEELAIGFLKSEGFLERPEDLMEINLDEEKGTAAVKGRADSALARKLLEKRTITSGCGKGTTFYHALDALQVAPPGGVLALPLARIIGLTAEINRRAAEGRRAGGVHHAGLAGEEGVAVIREDIGRHNAIDKIQGFCFLNRLPTGENFLMSTGRVSSEILIKAAKLGVPMIVSLSKPSALALELAERLRITVVGNLKGKSGFIYKDYGRVL